MRATLAELEAGRLVGIFPEGGISPDGRLGPGLRGVAALLLKGDAAILPVALVGTQIALSKSARLPRPVRVRVRFGELIHPEQVAAELSPAAAREEVLRRVMAALAEGLPREQKPRGELSVV
jgi:1-acyl-sn-glycerol-3-phosphate acyltransferase